MTSRQRKENDIVIKKVGVAGCGIMGHGVAIVCAQSGYQVVVSATNEAKLKKRFPSIDSFLSKSVEKEKITQQDKEVILARIKGITEIKDFGDCDLIIENITEDLDLKKKMFTELDKACPEHTILATNTSCLSIIDIAMATSRPDKVLGLHFMNPAPLMKLLEIVKTISTSDETLEIAKEFGKSLGKTIVIAKDKPGFIASCLEIPYLLNSMRIMDAGVATKEDIDTTMTMGFNHPMGPLALSDLIGLDILLSVTTAIYEETKDPQYAPPSVLKKMVTAGWLGRKTGKGFYDYG